MMPLLENPHVVHAHAVTISSTAGVQYCYYGWSIRLKLPATMTLSNRTLLLIFHEVLVLHRLLQRLLRHRHHVVVDGV